LATILGSVPDKTKNSLCKGLVGIEQGTILGTARSIAKELPIVPKLTPEDLEFLCSVCEFYGESLHVDLANLASAPFETARSRVEALFPNQRKKLIVALDEISEIIRLARASGVERKIMFRPGMIRNSEVGELLSSSANALTYVCM
jgi:hypothetical protein